ncbi:exodeoxyribonuclease [Pectobacterium parmentieri]|uniref:PD-(D/E)XK nuclease-like domain-containing protein n=1 Tax=Pectobacterium parmentieri TaxID=1905730 RepID=UPI00137388DA|nr:PD-(D/E)XK nuclease-like domain-containing protein [Pectobacterium parmentieri]QHQ16286.1 exodeoxyribonuclease [Pectobacterium parmentieri]
MNTYAFLIKAKAKSEKKSLFCWLSAKSDSRAEREIMNILEDEEIPTGRGGDYNLPLRTDWFVVDDLPEEGVLDDTWCDRYELNDDGQSWRQIPKSEPASTNTQDEHAAITGQTTSTQLADTSATDGTITIEQASFTQRVLGGWLFGSFTKLFAGQQTDISTLQHDMDATYVQNLLLALNNAKELLQAQHCFPETLFGLIDSTKSVWVPDGKAPSVGDIVSFSKEWLNAHNEDSTLERSGPYRSEVTTKWAKKSGVQRTESGAIAGSDNKTDRNPDYAHTLDTLDIEIAMFTTPFDFDIYSTPGPVYRRAKEIVEKKEQPFKTWSQFLRPMPGILNVSKAGIGALIRGADQDVIHFPDSLQRYINSMLTAEYYTTPTQELLALACHAPTNSATQESTETDEKLGVQPQVENLGDGKFSIEGLVSDSAAKHEERKGPFYTKQPATGKFNELFTLRKFNQLINEGCVEISHEEFLQLQADFARKNPEVTDEFSAGDTSNVQMETAGNQSSEADSALSTPANDDGSIEEARTALESAVSKWVGGGALPEEPAEPTVTDEPPYFEPGRYEGVSNNDYHAANGVSSTQVKDARVSLMYFNARHVAKTIARENSKVLDMGNLVHALALQPENLLAEFSIEPEIPQGAFTTTATIRAFIDKYNATLPAPLSADDIKALLDEYNATLTPQVALGASLEETGQSYMALPAEFQRIEDGQKQTASAMKACIKEYNATLTPQVKTSGSRDALLEQLAVINPDLVAQEAQKPAQLKVSGTKSDLIQSVKSVNPDAVFADELLDAWRENPEDKILVTRAQLATAQAIQKSLLNHPTAGKLLTHPSRAAEVSYFGFDDETGLEVRVRPDLEIDLDGVRIGCDLKTISMWNVKQDGLRAKLHREIIDRDYHLSAAMYSETATLDQFFWIFVNKDENYHWIAIVEASEELLELGMLEYRKVMRAIATGFDTDVWPAPIVDDYADELNDFDQRRLEALRMA